MKIKQALLLSAGLGTRMGKIGKIIPKPLWPFFDKTLLDLQINYLKSIGIEKIYINTHYLHKSIHSYIINNNISNITELYEPDLLRIGGTIHSLLDNTDISSSKLFVVNADQFYFPDKDIWQEAITKSDDYTSILFPLICKKGDGYNRLLIENNILKDIIKPDGHNDYLTFSGTSIVNMDKLQKYPGKSDYFETVANYKQNPIYVTEADNYQYYDFGTTTRYFNSCFRILNEYNQNKNVFFKNLDFLQMVKNFDNQDQYTLNFSNEKITNQLKMKSIILKTNSSLEIKQPGLYYEDVIEII